jgi:hypothetical protein
VPKWIARSQEADGLDRSNDYTTSDGVCQAGAGSTVEIKTAMT